MPALTNTHAGYIPDQGGRPISVQVEWSAGEITNHGELTPAIGRLPQGIKWRVGLAPMTALTPTWDPPVAYLYSGIPGQNRVLYAGPTDLSAQKPLEYLHGWAPLVPCGVYWLKVEWFDPTGPGWTAIIGTNPTYGANGYCDDPAIIIPRMRHAEVYEVRSGYPAPPYKTGPRTMRTDPIIVMTP